MGKTNCRWMKEMAGRILARSYVDIAATSQNVFHKIYCGDCSTKSAYEALQVGHNLGYELADILITDPPYCLLERRGKKGLLRDDKSIQKKIDNNDAVPRFKSVYDYKLFTQSWLSLCIQQGLKKGAFLIIWTNALGKKPIVDVCAAHSYALRGEYIWAKPSTGCKPAITSTKNEVLLRIYETALIFQSNADVIKQGIATSTNTGIGTDPRYYCDDMIPWSVVSGYNEITKYAGASTTDGDCSGQMRSVANGAKHSPLVHPCYKPTAVMMPLIRTWSRPSDTVLDPFHGGGGVLSAVMQAGEGRRFIGMERLPQWHAVVCDMINLANSQIK